MILLRISLPEPECEVLECSSDHACLTKGKEAFCVRQNELHMMCVISFVNLPLQSAICSHGLKIDSKTGLMLDIDGSFKPYSTDSISREYRERLELREEPQEVVLQRVL